jgi:hypothetical protein
MAKKSLKSRRKALQRKRAKRTQKRKEARSRASGRPSKQTDSRQVGEWPLHECLLTERWRDPDELVQILVSRRGPQGQVATAAFLVDLGCLGVKTAHSAVTESDRAHKQIRGDMERQQKMSPVSLNLVAKIIREGIAYAAQLGFRPHRDYHLAKWVLGDADPDACEDSIPLGRDGKPFFVAGPFDDVPKIMAKLERAVGSDGFHYLIHLEPPPGTPE